MKIKRFTPILVVERVEDSLGFWKERLGFEVATTVPHGEALGFAILRKDDNEVMLQSRASLEADLPQAARLQAGGTVMLYADVSSLEELILATDGAEVLVPKRRTFYGADEVWLREPSGVIVGFANFPPK